MVRKGIFPYEYSVTLISKSENNALNKDNYKNMMNKKLKFLNKMLANQMQQHVRPFITAMWHSSQGCSNNQHIQITGHIN